MKRLLATVVTGCLLAVCMVGVAESQCPGGVCRIPSNTAPEASAWRYATPAGHQRAACRVVCEDGGSQFSMGSGVLVRYRNQVVVLTANHNVSDRRGRVWVSFPGGKRHEARVIATDPTWDVAVLATAAPGGIEPAELASGGDALPRPGGTLRSCGFGRDGKFAVNAGQCVGYSRPTRGSHPTDWLSLTGHARKGDSGGPIFNSRGRVAAVLWGCGGGRVIGTQVGRLRIILDGAAARAAAVAQTQCPGGVCRPPRAPLFPLIPIRRKPPAPQVVPGQPQVVVQSDPAINGALQSIGDGVSRIAQNTEPPPLPDISEPEPGGMSPLLAGLIVLGSAVGGFALYFGTKG